MRDAREAGAVAIGPVLAVAGDPHHDETGVDGRQLGVAKPPFLERARAEVLTHHIGFSHKPAKQFGPFGMAQIEGDRFLVARFGQPRERIAPLRRRAEAAEGIAAARLLHLDDLGAEFREHRGRDRRGDESRAVEDADAR